MVTIALTKISTSIILLGDFNDRCKRFYSNHADSELKNRLVDLVRMNDLHQLITEPTRITPTSESLIDLVITDSPGYILNSGVTTPICNVDHHGVFCTVKFKFYAGAAFERKIYNYNAGDYIHLREILSDASWNTGYELFDDINDIVQYYYDIFKDAIDEFIPNRIIKIRPRDKEWMTPHIRYLLNTRDRLYRRYSKSKIPRSPQIIQRYSKCSKRIHQ